MSAASSPLRPAQEQAPVPGRMGPPCLATAFDGASVRDLFPILGREVHGRRLVYLDNAATTQKPIEVIEAVERYYRHTNSNVHRGVHALSQEATAAYEAARERTRRFLGAHHAHEIVFTRGTTEAINLVAQSWGGANVGPDDEILITHMEHHSNIVPWQLLAEATGATLRVVPMDDRGQLDLEAFERLLSPRTRVLGLIHVSNSLGTVNPIRRMIARAHEAGAVVLVDGAQAVHHVPVDVQRLDADFYVFSGHKIYGPTGIGVLYGREALLEAMPPWQGGGDMIRTVTFEKSTWNDLPYKFEAGTPNIAGAVGLDAALAFVERMGIDAIHAYESALLAYGTSRMEEVEGLRLIGTADEKASVLSFVMEGVHPHDVGTILDREGVAIRSGHHCTQPVMQHFGVPATSRASLALYNTAEDLDALVDALARVREVFA